jgi:hypothetical protein
MRPGLFICAQTGMVRDYIAENKAWNHRHTEMAKAGRYLRELRLARIISDYELEPDEFFTARDKAIMKWKE